MMINTKSLLKLAAEFYKKSVEILKNLPEELSSDKYDEDIMSLEKIFEERYPGQNLPAPLWDFKDDLQQPGFVGAGIMGGKEGAKKLLGYLYGYRFIYGDNWDDIDFNDAVWFVPDPKKELKNIRNAAKSGKILYMSNLVITPLYRLKLIDLIKEVIEQIKAQGYKYVSMQAQSDSFRLLVDSSGKPNMSRISKFGFELIMYTKDEEGGPAVILKVK
jgi:hypothetical protein